MSPPKTEPRRVRLQHVPVNYPISWAVHSLDGEYLAGFGNERAAREYMRLMNYQPI